MKRKAPQNHGEAFPPSDKPKPQRGNPIAPPGQQLAPPGEAAPVQPSGSSAVAVDAAPSGAVIAQFETSTGERSGPQLDVPLDTTPAQLQLIINSLLANEDKVPYSFYVSEQEVASSLGSAIGKEASTEQVIRIVYVPQAVFRVRAVARCTSTLPGHAEAILSTSFSADGGLLATGSGDHTVRLWDSNTELPKATLKAHRDWVLCIAWSACGRYLLSGGKDGQVAVWAPPQAEPLKLITAHKKWVNALAWAPLHTDPEQGRFCSASKDGTAAGGGRLASWSTARLVAPRVRVAPAPPPRSAASAAGNGLPRPRGPASVGAPEGDVLAFRSDRHRQGVVPRHGALPLLAARPRRLGELRAVGR